MKKRKTIQFLTSLTAYILLMFGLGCDQKILNNLVELQNSLVSTISFVIPGL